MTAILIDKYKGEIFVFGDGRLTKDDFTITDKAEKVFRVDNDTLWTGCGDMRLDEKFKQLVENNQLNINSVKELEFEGVFYVVKSDEITVVACEDGPGESDIIKAGIYKLHTSTLPLTDGSGGEMLQAAYDTLLPNKAKTREEYIARVTECFNKGCARLGSVGPLFSYKTIKIKN